jgi:hypothetical protein
MSFQLGANMGRSWAADIGLPQGWGPGPWDDEETTFSERMCQAGNLRPWQPGMRMSGSPIRTKSKELSQGGRAPLNLAELRPHDPTDVLKAPCWCGSIIVELDAAMVRACQTVSCLRPWCDSRCRRIRKR